MWFPFEKLTNDVSGAVAPTVAMSMFGLIAAGGIAFDYARLANLDTELQQAADQAALAAATQLDGRSGAMERAEAAARNLITNETLFANDSGGSNTGGGIDAQVDTASNPQSQGYTANQQAVVFYQTRADAEADTNGFDGTDPTRDKDAHFVRIRIETRTATYALTPIVGALSSTAGAQATAGLGSSICKVPPVMICNPAESSGNINENLVYNPTPGIGLRLVTGNATAPGNFGWLEASLGNGSNALAAALGYNAPPGDCQPISGVTTKTGMSTSVLNAFNTRFDIFANGNSTCPSQGGGTCNPASNTRKDLVCNSPGGGNCNSTNGWSRPSDFYKLPTENQTTCVPKKNGGQTCTTTTVSVQRPLASGDTYPKIMGYPHDICQADLLSNVLGTSCAIQGSGTWDRDAYFKVNYGWNTASAWQTGTGLPATAKRWDVYQWELGHKTVNVSGTNRGIAVAQQHSGNSYAHGVPATGTTGVAASSSQADRRRISAAVLNCNALNAHGKTTNAPVPIWLDLFLVEPAVQRGSGPNTYTDDKDVYVEVIGVTTASGNNGAGQVVRRDLPYLIK